jgi:hypothetical protein
MHASNTSVPDAIMQVRIASIIRHACRHELANTSWVLSGLQWLPEDFSQHYLSQHSEVHLCNKATAAVRLDRLIKDTHADTCDFQ